MAPLVPDEEEALVTAVLGLAAHSRVQGPHHAVLDVPGSLAACGGGGACRRDKRVVVVVGGGGGAALPRQVARWGRQTDKRGMHA